MLSKASLRQQRYRARRDKDGLVQVRAWVPRRLEYAYKAIALVMRAGEGKAEIESPTRKQLYELHRLQDRMSKTQIPMRIWTCRWQAEVYLTMHGKGTIR